MSNVFVEIVWQNLSFDLVLYSDRYFNRKQGEQGKVGVTEEFSCVGEAPFSETEPCGGLGRWGPQATVFVVGQREKTRTSTSWRRCKGPR